MNSSTTGNTSGSYLESITSSKRKANASSDAESTSNIFSQEQSTDTYGTTDSSFTDITSTLTTSAFTDLESDQSKHVTRQLLQSKQFLHDLQVLKIELSQKNLMIDTLKAESMNKIDDLEDKLSDAIHEKQLMQAKYETQIRIEREDAAKKIKRLKQELQSCLQDQAKLRDAKEKSEAIVSGMRDEVLTVELGEEEYLELKGKNEEDLTVQDKCAVALYENLRPLKVQVDALQHRLELASGDAADKDEEIAQLKLDNEEERQGRAALDVRCQHLQVQVEDLRSQLQHRHFKHQNFDSVQSERDTLERQIKDLEKNCMVYKSEVQSKSEEMERTRNQFLEQTQTVALLKQDKEYLTKQLNELQPRYQVLEDRFMASCKQLDEVKQAREDLYEKYVQSRDQFKQEYEERLKRELSEISTRTANELEKIKDNTKEMYERENRNLRDARDNAILQYERLTKCDKDAQSKYNELLGEFRQLQLSSDGKLSECQSELKLKTFELDRVQLLHEESLKNAKQLGVGNEALQKKLQALSKEYYALQSQSERKISELESKAMDTQSKLGIYEKLEQELDDVVMQAAEVADEADSERVLFAYGYGANLPSTAKRRMQQSVQLARRVLQLERANTSLRHDVERETKKQKQLSSELKNTTSMLNEAQQPYTYLIDSIRNRDEQNKRLKETISTLESDISDLKEENQSLKHNNGQMSVDLERLLNQREELNVLKQVVTQLQSSGSENGKPLITRKVARTSTTVYGPHASERETAHEKSIPESAPRPIVFTKADPPNWYLRLRQKNEQKLKTSVK